MKTISSTSPLAKEALKLFSNLLEKNRRIKKISQAELAERCGVSRSTIQNLLKGDSAVAIGTYFEVAVILGVSLFSENKNRVYELAKESQEILSLLPAHIHTSKESLRDDF